MGLLLRWLAAVAVVLLVLALWRRTDGGPNLTAADVDRAAQRRVEQAQREQRAKPPDAAAAYRAIQPSFVTVTTERASSTGGPTADPAESGLGSGVVINAEGAVLTALHVVAGAQQIHVQFADGAQATARVATSQPENDIAVLAVDHLPQVVVPAVMGGPPPVGDAVFAVGNPLGLQASLTAGVVSARDRRIRSESGTTLDGLIQFDAAVNPGNSGGPLLNRAGQVVGIVTALANPSKQSYFIGIAFAVPIATAGGAAGGPQQ
ncbi:MAG: trypsin-like peptidase domain-containing protein [Actinomycetota bacterium]